MLARVVQGTKLLNIKVFRVPNELTVVKWVAVVQDEFAVCPQLLFILEVAVHQAASVLDVSHDVRVGF